MDIDLIFTSPLCTNALHQLHLELGPRSPESRWSISLYSLKITREMSQSQRQLKQISEYPQNPTFCSHIEGNKIDLKYMLSAHSAMNVIQLPDVSIIIGGQTIPPSPSLVYRTRIHTVSLPRFLKLHAIMGIRVKWWTSVTREAWEIGYWGCKWERQIIWSQYGSGNDIWDHILDEDVPLPRIPRKSDNSDHGTDLNGPVRLSMS